MVREQPDDNFIKGCAKSFCSFAITYTYKGQWQQEPCKQEDGQPTGKKINNHHGFSLENLKMGGNHINTHHPRKGVVSCCCAVFVPIDP